MVERFGALVARIEGRLKVAPGYPEDRLIAVNLDLYVTRVFNSDYFGESKKGGLRMWNHLVFERGGLALHAGCKMIPTSAGVKTGLIVGLSGTGKTTTTFTRQNGSLPVQDDFVAWWPDGSISATEAGCFAKTFALNPKDEPTIHGAVTKPGAYLENVSMDDHGVVDFFDESYTKNGRAVFSFKDIEAAEASSIQQADFLLVLNRNENVIPAVARLEGPQAAAFFMLGETTGTAAGGNLEGFPKRRRDVLRARHQVVVLGDRQRDAGDVRFLERVGADELAPHLAGDADNRRAVQHGRGDA